MPPRPLLPTARVGLLGGMGPAAGVELARAFVQACQDILRRHGMPVHDQAFPAHVLLQLPLPDRTAALLAGDHDGVAHGLDDALRSLDAFGASVVGIACNTAHAWHARLQGARPEVELLHVAHVVLAQLQRLGARCVGLLATRGTYLAGIYDRILEAAGMRCVVPQAAEQEALMRGIYLGIKAGDRALAKRLFGEVAAALCARHGVDALILGCTEIPLALDAGDAAPGVALLDPAELLAKALAERAYGIA